MLLNLRNDRCHPTEKTEENELEVKIKYHMSLFFQLTLQM